MRNIFTRKEFAVGLACALAFGLLSETASAQVGQDEHAIVMDSSGVPVTSGFGLCILSEERVDAVKTYLVGKGLAAQRVQTSARGETRPSTQAGECKDANNAKNVACMQPDRHVFPFA